MWDEEVDVVCTGSGIAGLAHAVTVAALGGEAFVAGGRGNIEPSGSAVAVRSRVGRLQWLDVDVRDPETNEYFAALSSDLGPLTRSAGNVDVPIRMVEHAEPIDPRGAVAPFVGARLRDWAARCLVSPYGYLYTRVSDWQSTKLRTVEGDSLEFAEIGSITPDPANIGGSVLEFLIAQARDRDIEVNRATSLRRIVFEEGVVVGAEFATPDGPMAVRARHGVAVAGGGPQVAMATGQSLPADDPTLRVCLVAQTASRFGRVELFTSEPFVARAASTCRPVDRNVRANLHETQSHLQTWRCGKGDGYPSNGQ
jgi:hypothetical protein